MRAAGLAALVRVALAEDVGTGDVTTRATVPEGAIGRARIIARGEGVVAGLAAAAEVYRQVDAGVVFGGRIRDGARVTPGGLVATADGAFASLLVAERTVLNFLQRLSGVATLTAQFAAAVEGTGATIVDTRKTTPGWRAVEKEAVLAGGGRNHRMGLYDAYLIKENHIAAAGGIEAALAATDACNPAGKTVEIEVRTFADLEAVLAAAHPPDRVLCDNFDTGDLARAVERVRHSLPTMGIEASGSVTLANVRRVAETGVDWISVGALTHSAPVLDLSCLIERV